MTRRERMENRLEKRLEWAEGRKAKATADGISSVAAMVATDPKPIKTRSGWSASGLDLSHYLQPGDVVDEEMADYFLCVLPPVCNTTKIIQIGEPHSYAQGGETFSTIENTSAEAWPSATWIYRGHCHRGETKPL